VRGLATRLGSSLPLKRPGFRAFPRFFEHSLSDFRNPCHTVLRGTTAESAVNEAGMANGTILAPKRRLDARGMDEACAPAKAAKEPGFARSGRAEGAQRKRALGVGASP